MGGGRQTDHARSASHGFASTADVGMPVPRTGPSQSAPVQHQQAREQVFGVGPHAGGGGHHHRHAALTQASRSVLSLPPQPVITHGRGAWLRNSLRHHHLAGQQQGLHPVHRRRPPTSVASSGR